MHSARAASLKIPHRPRLSGLHRDAGEENRAAFVHGIAARCPSLAETESVSGNGSSKCRDDPLYFGASTTLVNSNMRNPGSAWKAFGISAEPGRNAANVSLPFSIL